MSAAESWPPEPWPRITRASSAIGAGQATPVGSMVARGSSRVVIAKPQPASAGHERRRARQPLRMPIPRPAAWKAAQVPSVETIGAPSGIRGVHSVP